VDTFQTPTPPRLSVDLRAGSVTIDTSDVAQTTVEILPLNDSSVTLDALGATTVEQRGDDITVHVPSRFGHIGRTPKLAVRISAPNDSRLRLKTGGADVVAVGRFGTSDVSTGSGDLTLGDFSDSLRVNSGSGDVRVESVAKDVVVKTGSGDIDIVDVDGEASLSSGSGDVIVGGATRGLDAKTASGDITVGTAPPDLRATTASGDIRIDLVEAGEVRVKAASGDIHAGVRNGTAAWLDVHTVSGRVSSELDGGGAEPADDERTVRLSLKTVSGDIELARV
jgi:DUF4097 and DUF4098 domain-containing protein YvlB